MTARSLPCAICSSCKAYSHDKQMIDGVCGSRAVESPPCEGRWLNRDRFIDWLRCKTFNGTGYYQIKRCPDCKNSGWVPAR